MRNRAGETCLAAALVFIFFGVIDANICANEVLLDPNSGTPPAMRTVSTSPSPPSVCDATANRPAFCMGLRPGAPAMERFSPR